MLTNFLIWFIIWRSIAFVSYKLIGKSVEFSIRRFYGSTWQHYKINPQEAKLKEQLARAKPNFTMLGITLALVYVTYSMVLGMSWEPSKVYDNLVSAGVAHFFISAVAFILWWDFCFYLLHRFAFHTKWMFRKVHVIHHTFPDPTMPVRVAFSIFESMAYEIFGCLILLVMDINPCAIILGRFVVINYVNILNHLGYETFPSGFTKRPFLKMLTTSTHHTMHHMHRHGNYSLLINYDLVFNTQNPDYEKTFEEIKSRTSENLKVYHSAS